MFIHSVIITTRVLRLEIIIARVGGIKSKVIQFPWQTGFEEGENIKRNEIIKLIINSTIQFF